MKAPAPTGTPTQGASLKAWRKVERDAQANVPAVHLPEVPAPKARDGRNGTTVSVAHPKPAFGPKAPTQWVDYAAMDTLTCPDRSDRDHDVSAVCVCTRCVTRYGYDMPFPHYPSSATVTRVDGHYMRLDTLETAPLPEVQALWDLIDARWRVAVLQTEASQVLVHDGQRVTVDDACTCPETDRVSQDADGVFRSHRVKVCPHGTPARETSRVLVRERLTTVAPCPIVGCKRQFSADNAWMSPEGESAEAVAKRHMFWHVVRWAETLKRQAEREARAARAKRADSPAVARERKALAEFERAERARTVAGTSTQDYAND